MVVTKGREEIYVYSYYDSASTMTARVIIYPNNMRMSFEGLYNPPNVLSGGIVCADVRAYVCVCAKHFIRCILMNLVEFLLFKLISHLVLIIQSRFRNDECREHAAYHSLFHAL